MAQASEWSASWEIDGQKASGDPLTSAGSYGEWRVVDSLQPGFRTEARHTASLGQPGDNEGCQSRT